MSTAIILIVGYGGWVLCGWLAGRLSIKEQRRDWPTFPIEGGDYVFACLLTFIGGPIGLLIMLPSAHINVPYLRAIWPTFIAISKRIYGS